MNSNIFDENGYKKCPGCGESKNQDEYYNTKQTVNGKLSRCKTCTDAVNKAWQEANPEKYEAAQKTWREENEGHTYTESTSGYVNYIGFAHPASNPSGVTRYHRIILWDKIGPGEHECHWGCGKVLSWDVSFKKDSSKGLVVDHLNGIRDDNRPENLVASCVSCNSGISRLSRKVIVDCGFEGCGNEAISKGFCKGHYMQNYKGLELKPLRKKVFKDENGKECSGCETYKTWDNYYSRSNGVGYQNQCKPCMIKHNTQNTLARKGVAA